MERARKAMAGRKLQHSTHGPYLDCSAWAPADCLFGVNSKLHSDKPQSAESLQTACLLHLESYTRNPA
jgi:hypothetical protein